VIPRLGRKLLLTTVVSALIFAACYVVYVNHLVTLEGLAKPFGMR
jgi:predicted secreted protein